MRPPRDVVRLGVALGLACVTTVGCSNSPTPEPPTRPPVAFAPIEVTGVGEVALGSASGEDLVIRVTEAGPASIMAGPGSFQVTLTDHAGLSGSVSFVGTPTVSAPGSLGVTASLTRPNVLTVEIVDSDTVNIEQMTIEHLGIQASTTASLGAVNAIVSGCAGSLAGCTATNVLPSPASVVAGP